MVNGDKSDHVVELPTVKERVNNINSSQNPKDFMSGR